jgi:hypothetical protein
MVCSEPGCPMCSTLFDLPRPRRSVRTMFEFRARSWVIFGALLVALALLAYLITRTLVPLL